jgi:hypothetical protein
MRRRSIRSGLALPLLLLALVLLAAAVRAFPLRPTGAGAAGPSRPASAAAAAARRSRRGGSTRLHSIRTGGGGKGRDDEVSGYGPERIQDPDAALTPEEWQKKYGEEVDTTVLYDEKVPRVCLFVFVSLSLCFLLLVDTCLWPLGSEGWRRVARALSLSLSLSLTHATLQHTQELERRRIDAIRIAKYMDVMGAVKKGEPHPRIALAAKAHSKKEVERLTHGMLYRKLGKSDLVVSEVCLGTMTWGEQCTEEQAHAQLDMAVDEYGVNFVVRGFRNPLAVHCHCHSYEGDRSDRSIDESITCIFI